MFMTVSARQIQRDYRKILDKANKEQKPIVVMAHNRPVGAVIGLDLLEKLQLETILKQALEESEKKQTVIIDTPEKLKASFDDMRKEAAIK